MKIKDGVVQLNVFDDILDGITKEQKLELARLICWDDDVLEEFVDRLMTEYASESMDSHIHKARLRFVEMMPQGAAALIRALVAEVERAKASAHDEYELRWELERQWPNSIQCPDCEKSVYNRLPQKPEWRSINTPNADDIMRKCGYLFTRTLACGCVLCTCEDDVRCQGCGAKCCNEHSTK